MTKILFLDVDGPLIPLRSYVNGQRQRHPTTGFFIWDKQSVDGYNHLTNKHGAKIVFNTMHNENGLLSL